jgi:ABC-type multidrug transport system ATPase subunit
MAPRCGRLSGGEMRRLSLALVIIKQSRVLLLDELTSGLDSHAALEIMRVVRRIAHSQGMLVVCTIHQPSERLLATFDELILLRKGLIAYQGKVGKVLETFEPIFGAKPDNMGTSEFLLESINTDFGNRDDSKVR